MFNNHSTLKTILLPFPMTGCVMRGKKQKQLPSSCPGDPKWASAASTGKHYDYPLKYRQVLPAKLGIFFFPNYLCSNRDRLEVTCLSGRVF